MRRTFVDGGAPLPPGCHRARGGTSRAGRRPRRARRCNASQVAASMTSTVAGKAVGVARSGQRAALALSISVPEVVDDDNGIRANAIARLFAFPPAGNDWGIALIRRQSLTFNPPYQTLAPLLYAAPFPIPESLRRPIY